MPSQTAIPNNLPYPLAGDPPDIPSDIKALADATHTRLDEIKKLVDDNNAALVKITKKPNQWTTKIVTASSGFTVSTQSLWRWGYMCYIEVGFTTTSDRTSPTGEVGTDLKMGTWAAGMPTPYGNFAISSFYEGRMALGFVNSSTFYLSSLEAQQKWLKNTKLRFGGVYITNIERA